MRNGAGRRATTHWAYCQDFARRYPDVSVDPETGEVDYDKPPLNAHGGPAAEGEPRLIPTND